MRFAKNELDVPGTLEPMLPRCAEFLNDCLRAPAHFPHVNADRPTVNAILGGAPGQVSYAGAGDHALRRRAAYG